MLFCLFVEFLNSPNVKKKLWDKKKKHLENSIQINRIWIYYQGLCFHMRWWVEEDKDSYHLLLFSSENESYFVDS